MNRPRLTWIAKSDTRVSSLWARHELSTVEPDYRAGVNGFMDFAFDVRVRNNSDALKIALSANSQHGFKRTNADKRRSVELALNEWPEYSNSVLGRICVVSHTFVEGLRGVKQPATVAGCARIGPDGKVHRLPRCRVGPRCYRSS